MENIPGKGESSHKGYDRLKRNKEVLMAVGLM
jgi:hypothetical protein